MLVRVLFGIYENNLMVGKNKKSINNNMRTNGTLSLGKEKFFSR